MAGRFTTYDPKSVAVIVGGVPLTGFADDMVSIEFQEDSWEHIAGADGEEMRIRKNDGRAEMTVTLLQSSESNSWLAGLQLADEASNSAAFPVLFKDSNGKTLMASEAGWIKKTPNISRGKSASNVEWVIALSQARAFAGGYG